jgi:hypothetical protein
LGKDHIYDYVTNPDQSQGDIKHGFLTPFVNQTLAYQALAMLARLFRYGRLSYHGGFVNLQTGRTAPIAVNTIGWKRMQRVRMRSTDN